MNRNYELMLLFHPSVDGKDEKTMSEVILKLVGQNKTEKIVIGKKSLAYPIKKQTEGVYVLCKVSAGSLAVSQLEKNAQAVGDKLLRFLLKRVD